MFDAYVKIFTRFGLKFRPVAADNGAIGGSGSHEFHVIAETGEDALVYSRESEYAANMEAAIALPPSAERAAATRSMQKVATPGQKACEDVTNFLNQPLSQSLKVIAAIRTDIAAGEKGHFVVILMRGDHDLNESKHKKSSVNSVLPVKAKSFTIWDVQPVIWAQSVLKNGKTSLFMPIMP